MKPTWEQHELAEHSIEIFSPHEARTDLVILFLPDYDQRASEFEALTAALALRRVIAVAPMATACWWLDRTEPQFGEELTPIAFLRQHVVPFIEQRFNVRPPGIKLLGDGVGGQGSFQLAFRRPKEFPAVAAIDPAIDFHELYGRGTSIDGLFSNREAARQETAILRLHPAGWPRRMRLIAERNGFWFGGAEKLDMKLKSMGIPIDTTFAEHAGAEAFRDQWVGAAIDFLLADRATLPVIGPHDH
jgi:enterochelin esterase-like enzyme